MSLSEMAHQRKLIREAVVAALKAAATGAGDRVYETRRLPHRRVELPAIGVYSLEEDSETKQTAPRILSRTLDLVIEAAVQDTGNADDALDAIAEEIENAMHPDPMFGGVCGDSFLSATTMAISEIGNLEIGVVRLIYTVSYRTDAPEESDDLDDFASAGVHYNVGGEVEEDDEAVDEIEVPTE